MTQGQHLLGVVDVEQEVEVVREHGNPMNKPR